MRSCCRIPARPRTRPSRPSRQAGAVLFIALIVLVAMTLAGIALMRSVDTTLGIAGNMAFKQATIQGADRGVKVAFDWLAANSGGTTLQNTDTAVGYFSSKPANEPDWFDIAQWTNAVRLPNEGGFVGQPDNAGNVVRYIIHRMCNCADVPYNTVCTGSSSANVCALYYPPSGASSGGSMSVGAAKFEGIPQLYYRVTTRVDGPRNTISITQVTVLIQV
jgi:Tfp pilus assembly protein PilX